MVKNRVRETFRGIPEEQIKEFVIYGTPEDDSAWKYSSLELAARR
jgi:hypothetical protein